MTPATVSTDRKARRTALARAARRIADETENLYIQLEQIGALARIRQYMIIHEEGVPRFDLLQTAKRRRALAYCQCNGDARISRSQKTQLVS